MAAITFGIQDVPTKRAVAELQRQIDELRKGNASQGKSQTSDGSAPAQSAPDLSGIQSAIQSLQTNVETLRREKVSLRIASASAYEVVNGYMRWTFTIASNEKLMGMASFNLGSFSGTIGHLWLGENVIQLAATTSGTPNVGSVCALVMKVGT